MNTPDPLVAFAEARISEDEAAAHAAGGSEERWYADGGSVSTSPDYPFPEVVSYTSAAEHIARHDPARVLRESAGRRATLALHRPEETEYIDGDGNDRVSVDCAECDTGGVPCNWPCLTARHLVATWADHDHYDPAWDVTG